MGRRAITTRELLLAVMAILVVAALSYPLLQRAWQRRQERLNTELGSAVVGGDTAEVRRLLERGADPNTNDDQDEWPVLTCAAERGDIQVARLLIAYGADTNAKAMSRSGRRRSPLHAAVWARDREMAKLLLGAGADIELKAASETPLRSAIGRRDMEMARLLIAWGADVSPTDYMRNTPLHTAMDRGYEDFADLLIAHGADPNVENDRGETPLHKAVYRGNMDVVELLLDAGADVNAADKEWARTPLHTAAGQGPPAIITLLIAQGADVNARMKKGTTPLHWAGSRDRAEPLIAHGADVNARADDGSSALDRRAWHAWNWRGNMQTAELLLDSGAEWSLHSAAGLGNGAQVQELLAAGADANARLRLGTALDFAARGGHADVTELLITAGADVNTRHRDGTTALHYAAGGDHVGVAELLIAAGADVNARRGPDRETPLDVARKHKHAETAKLLREHGADR